MSSHRGTQTNVIESGGGTGVPEAGAPLPSRGPGYARFFVHMAVASFLAPAMGGAVYSFSEVQWGDCNIATRMIGSLLGAPVLLVFIWFITIPFGLITYGACLAAKMSGVTNRLIWATGGALTGLGFGWFMASFAQAPVILFSVSGTVIGLVSSMALWQVWQSGQAER